MKKERGITLIALIITIILMLILAGIVLNLTIGKNGLFNTAKYAVQKNSEETAKEKLELALADLTSHKYTNENYNENEYINSYLINQGMDITGNIVTVDNWKFTIDRSVPKIGESLGQSYVKITKQIKEYLGYNENNKYEVNILLMIESLIPMQRVTVENIDGTILEITPEGEKLKIDKNMNIELNQEYKVKIELSDGKTEERTIYVSQGPTFANAPNIEEFNKLNSYYVTWDLTSAPYKIQETKDLTQAPPSNWYDYTFGINHWANIKTTGGENDCYWVWIPRYAYKITYDNPESRASGVIDVVFLKDKTNKDINGKDVTQKEYIDSKGNTGAYIVHPAFTNDGNGGFGDLTGIWVAKYEASSNSVSEETLTTDLNGTGGGNVPSLNVRVKPNVTSWRGMTVGNMFTVCQALTTTGNSLEGTTNIDSHMIKNTEWGAVAYLSRSIYGKNGPVWNNPYYNNTSNYSSITGLCGGTQDAKQTNFTNIYKYNEIGGENASTTGNVYGIYDMAGGADEYVAGILSSKKSNGNYYDFSSINPKYYDSYDGYNAKKYGDAIYETSTTRDRMDELGF